jgi:large subunit ribosomal protein L13e
LKEYKSKLVLFPLHAKKPKTGEATKEEQSKAAQQSTVLPLKARVHRVETVNKSAIDTKTSVYATLRKARTDARLVGVRAKRKAEKEAAAAATKKD